MEEQATSRWSPRATGSARTFADDRNARLAVSLSGTNLVRAGDYNQRVVLQAIRTRDQITRGELAELTGLTGPTVANISRRLVESGLVAEVGRRYGGRGQPALRLAIDPDGCFSIGVNIDRDHVTVLTLDFAGSVRRRTLVETAFAMPDEVHATVLDHVTQTIESDGVPRERICGIGVASPDGLARADVPHRPADYEVWDRTDVTRLLADILPVAIHIDNDAAAAAIGELQFGRGMEQPSFFYILVSTGLGGGLVLDGSYHRGAAGRSGELGFLAGPAGRGTVEQHASVAALLDEIAAEGLGAFAVHRLAEAPEPVAAVVRRWIDSAAAALVEPLVAINCLINPGRVLIGSRLPEPILEALVAAVARTFAAEAARVPVAAPIERATLSADGPAIGAAILPFNDLFLPNEASLMKIA